MAAAAAAAAPPAHFSTRTDVEAFREKEPVSGTEGVWKKTLIVMTEGRFFLRGESPFALVAHKPYFATRLTVIEKGTHRLLCFIKPGYDLVDATSELQLKKVENYTDASLPARRNAMHIKCTENSLEILADFTPCLLAVKDDEEMSEGYYAKDRWAVIIPERGPASMMRPLPEDFWSLCGIENLDRAIHRTVQDVSATGILIDHGFIYKALERLRRGWAAVRVQLEHYGSALQRSYKSYDLYEYTLGITSTKEGCKLYLIFTRHKRCMNPLIGAGGDAKVSFGCSLSEKTTFYAAVVTSGLPDSERIAAALHAKAGELPIAKVITSFPHYRKSESATAPTAMLILKQLYDGDIRAILLQRQKEGEGAIPLGNVLSIGEAILKVLTYMHSIGIAHRDVKMENVLLRRHSSGEYKAFVNDFGRASTHGDLETLHIGTTLRMLSPEFADEFKKNAFDHFSGSYAAIDPFKADVWAAGLILWELCLNAEPFPSFRLSTGSGIIEMILTHCKEADWVQQRLLADKRVWPGPLVSLLQAMLTPDPSVRISAEEAYSRLKALQACPEAISCSLAPSVVHMEEPKKTIEKILLRPDGGGGAGGLTRAGSSEATLPSLLVSPHPEDNNRLSSVKPESRGAMESPALLLPST